MTEDERKILSKEVFKMLVIVITQEPEEYGEHQGEYRVIVKDDTGRYERYYTYIPEAEEVKIDIENFGEEFLLIEK
jgi:hypothetical protein